MPFDAPLAEPARTRRSARTAPTPVQATEDVTATKTETVMTRAEARRRAALGEAGQPVTSTQSASARPLAFVRPAVAEQSTAAEQPAAAEQSTAAEQPAVAEQSTATEQPAVTDQPLTRRRARRHVGPVPAASAAETLSTVSLDAEHDIAPSVEVASTVEPAATASPSSSASAEGAPRAEAASVPEPAALTAPVAAAPRAADSTALVDEFEAAARLFSFTGETPVQSEPVAQVEAVDEPAEPAKKKHKVRRRRKGHSSIKRMATASASVGAIVAVGLLTVGMTMSPEAVASPDAKLIGASAAQRAGDVSAEDSGEIQAYVAPVDATAAGTELDRSANYTTATLTEMAGTTGISNATSSYYTNNPACAVQWPFAVGVPITYGFGWRPGEFHTGADFTPGAGAHVQAIADGVVRVAQEGYQGYGVAIIIDHEIDGQHWASLYGHMQYGSLQVHAGEHVKVGQYIGRTGNTGFSFGAHTHVEIRQNGVTPIDPLPWLRAHNQC